MAREGEYQVGLARAVITPAEPMWAAGYAARNRPADGKVHDLYAKAMVTQDHRGQGLVIVTTDLLGLPRVIADPVAEAIGRRFGLTRERVMLTSSHTHSGPVLIGPPSQMYNLAPSEWAKVERYSSQLEQRLINVVGEAMDQLAPAHLSYGRGRASFAANRRERTEEGIIIGHDPAGPVDHDAPVLRVAAPDGTVRAMLFGYACHCTTMDFYEWCGDYAGFAQADLEARHPGAAAMFVAGCGADANPQPRRDLGICKRHGHELADAVEQVLDEQMTALTGPLAAAFRRIDLPFEQLPSREQLEHERDQGDPLEKARAALLLAQLDAGRAMPPTYPYLIQVFQLGNTLTLVALAGEVVVDYSHRLKRELGPEATWIIAYANEVFAYIPSRRVLAEGGYEADTAAVVYGLPARWSLTVEDMIVAAVRDLARQVRPA